jgi:hypothetical protein
MGLRISPESGGRYPEVLAKSLGEVSDAAEAYAIGHLANRRVGLAEQVRSVLETQVPE